MAGINSTSRKSIGRKSLLHKTEHFEKLVSYLKDIEESQYSIVDLMYQLNEYAGMQMIDGKFSEDVFHVKH